MKKMFFMLLLMGGSLLLPAPQLLAKEQVSVEPPEPEIDISVEDRKIIELMELLQMMEMLQDFQVMTIEEEKE